MVCYGDSIVAHIGINSCMFSLSLCSAVTDAFLRQSFFKCIMCCLKTYSRLFRVIHVLQIDNFSQSATDVVCVCMLQCTSALKVRDQLLNIHCNIRIGTLSINLCVCTAIVMKCFSTPPQNHLVLIFAQLLSQQTSNTVCACTILRPVWPG